MMNSNQLLSHQMTNKDTMERLQQTVDQVTARIQAAGNQPHVTVAEQLDILQQLIKFDLGCFLLQNQGLNGFWTHYVLRYPVEGAKTGLNNQGQPFSKLEKFLLAQVPSVIATQQRWQIFFTQIQSHLRNNTTLACIPCGMMGEFFYLDFSTLNGINLVGIDYDAHTFAYAKQLATERGFSDCTEYLQADAWSLDITNTYDLISSNGLTIYEPSDTRVAELYQVFYRALKPGGKLVTSFCTPESDWHMHKIAQADLRLQNIIFNDIIDVNWRCSRTERQTAEWLAASGFHGIEFFYDEAHMFPTVVAYK